LTPNEGEKSDTLGRFKSFLLPAVEVVVTLLLKPSGVYLSAAIGFAVALMALAFSLAGLDKNLVRKLRGACARCLGYHHGLVLFAAAILAIIATNAVPKPGAGNPLLPYALYVVSGLLIAEIVRHGYVHRVLGKPRNHRYSYITGVMAAFVAAFLALLAGLMQF